MHNAKVFAAAERGGGARLSVGKLYSNRGRGEVTKRRK